MSEDEKIFNIIYTVLCIFIMMPGLVALSMVLTNGATRWAIFIITELCTYLLLKWSYKLYDVAHEAYKDTL